MIKDATTTASTPTRGIVETREHGLVVLSPSAMSVRRRLLYVDGYGGAQMWEKIKKGLVPPHHLRGCLELVRMGYEVALAEPLPDFYLHKNPFPHDLKYVRMVRSWLGSDGIVFCGHNVLYWIPLLSLLGIARCHIVSNLWAREPLNLAGAHSGILALTGAAAEQAKKLAPNVKVAHLGWGADLSVYPRLPYQPESFFSCGIALRDFETMSKAAARVRHCIQVIYPGTSNGLTWPSNVQVVDGGRGWNTEEKKVTYDELLYKHYAKSTASLIIVKADPLETIACGFTELVEVMAMARPVILTKTGAMPTEIDVEKVGCGLLIPAGDPVALAEAMDALANNPQQAQSMGECGRRLAETRYNIERYANDLHSFFESFT